MLPKFLLADNRIESPDLFYVVHTQEPKFIVEFDSEDSTKNKSSIGWTRNRILILRLKTCCLKQKKFIIVNLMTS